MVSIYCIEDINNLKYIGSTKNKLNSRLTQHKYHKKINHKCTSKLLDLDNCKIYSVEECDESNRKEREQFWIDNTECVNQLNTLFDKKKFNKQYYQLNKEHIKQYQEENKECRTQCQKEYYHYKIGWGGDKRYYNNLLSIDINIFN